MSICFNYENRTQIWVLLPLFRGTQRFIICCLSLYEARNVLKRIFVTLERSHWFICGKSVPLSERACNTMTFVCSTEVRPLNNIEPVLISPPRGESVYLTHRAHLTSTQIVTHSTNFHFLMIYLAIPHIPSAITSVRSFWHRMNLEEIGNWALAFVANKAQEKVSS